MDNQNQYYNNWAENPPLNQSKFLFDYYFNKILKKVEKHIKIKKVFEIGIGFGEFGLLCLKRGYEYKGMEMNERLTLMAREKGLNVELGKAPPIPKHNFDTVWLSHVLEHNSTSMEARNMIEDIYNSLNSGGHLVLISPDILSWKQEFWNVDWSHGYPTSIKNVSQMFKDAGFKIIYSGYINRNLLTWLIPHRLLDFLISPFTNRTLFYSFKSLFGWRQFMIIGEKRR